MTYTANNELWKKRLRTGANVKYTAEQIAEKAIEYFQWVEDNPIKEQKIVVAGGEIEKVYLEKKRPMTEKALVFHMGIHHSTWIAYKEDKKDYAKSELCLNICRFIANQKFEGAAVGIFNHAIIARDLGLVETSKVDVTTNIEVDEKNKKKILDLISDDELKSICAKFEDNESN